MIAKDNLDAMKLCLCFLEESGFEIISSSKRGINFQGSAKLFEDTFHSKISMEGNPHFVNELKFPESISNAIKGIYFPTKPQLF